MEIGIWGDSITFGSCDSEALGWAGRLRKTLPSDDYNQLYNFGICGETTEDLLKRFDIEAKAIEPNKIVFAIGINDSKFPSESDVNNVTLGEFEQNLKELIKQAKNYTNEITFIGLTRVDDEWRSVRGSRFLNEEIEKYDSIIKKVAGEHNCDFISTINVVDPVSDLADGLHPNATGYQKMFERIKSEIGF
ncbi:MAG: SGNH/GDSL hydrolase family protein [Patescibacteria group bacterium]